MTISPRDWETILVEILSYAPTGWGLSHDPDSVLAAVMEPLARGLARLEAEAAERRQTEVSPATAIHCLDDYERILGPDPCRPGGFADTLAERQALAHARWTEEGGQSVPYFTGLAAQRGVEISIEEFAPARCGITECGTSWSTPDEWGYPDGGLLAAGDGALIVTETAAPLATGPLALLPPRWQVGPPRMADYWRVAFGPRAIEWARCGEAVAAETPHCIFEAEAEVECVIRRRAPAHTIPVFDYTAHAWQPPQPLRGLH